MTDQTFDLVFDVVDPISVATLKAMLDSNHWQVDNWRRENHGKYSRLFISGRIATARVSESDTARLEQEFIDMGATIVVEWHSDD